MTTERELCFERDGKRIYGTLYVEETGERMPVLILCHGYGGDARGEAGFARYFADRGFAAYTFDFIGGGNGSRSEGSPAEMSVLTEERDLMAVIDGIREQDFADPCRIFLWGESQGGFVASLTASDRPEDIAGVVALFPAYVLQDDSKKRAPDPDAIPERMDVMGMTLGAVYHRDALSFDIYDRLPNYPGPVLLMHGEADTLVPISYSERAEKVFPDARLVRFPGAGHGFGGADWLKAAETGLDFLNGVRN